MTRTRLTPTQRYEDILRAAIDLSIAGSYRSVTRKQIADRAGVSEGLVSHYLGDTEQGIPSAVMRAAVNREILTIIAQGLVNQNPIAQGAPKKTKAKALKEILT